jgi:hypothetical protein
MSKYNNDKVEIRDTDKKKGIFAKELIKAGELIGVFDGEVYCAESESRLPNNVRDQAIPFGNNYYRDGMLSSFGRFINHSCNPNCYIKNYFEIYSIKDIAQGEELTIMYSLVMDSDWQNPEGVCLCGSDNCKGKIVPYRDLSTEEKVRWLPYTAEWILYEEAKVAGLLNELPKIWQRGESGASEFSSRVN